MIYFVSFLGTLAVLPGNIVSALLMDKIGRLRMLGEGPPFWQMLGGGISPPSQQVVLGAEQCGWPLFSSETGCHGADRSVLWRAALGSGVALDSF